jgi:adenylate cyclase
LVLGWFWSRPLVSALKDLRDAADRSEPGASQPGTASGTDEVRGLAGAILRLKTRLSDQEKVRHILGKKVSPEVSRKILASGEELAVKGERRRCTVLFARLTGLRPPDDSTPPDQWMKVLNECLESLSEAVLDQEGTLDRFGNGTLKAFWGAPIGLDNQEQLALSAAFEMRQRLARLNERRVTRGEDALSLSVGLHTSIMLAGYIGSDQASDYTVLGEEAERSEAISRSALSDQILASQAFYQALAGHATFRRLDLPKDAPLASSGPLYEALDVEG